jgi:hypothetical protein
VLRSRPHHPAITTEIVQRTRIALVAVLALVVGCADDAGAPEARDSASGTTTMTATTVTVPKAFPKVVVGRDGWLFLGEDVERACTPAFSVDATLERLTRLERMIVDSGRRMVLVVPPDKSSIAPEYLPDEYAGDECATARTRAFWARFEADPPVSGYVDLRAPLLWQQAADGVPIYRKLDTHWTPHAATVYVHELANALDPELWEGTRVEQTGSTEVGGDLAQLLGRPATEAVAQWDVVRPGVDGNFARVGLRAEPVAVANTSSGVALFGPRTALLLDSFSLRQVSGSTLFSLFADASALYTEAASPETIAGMIAGAEVVVVEAVERYIVSGTTVLLADATLTAIDAALGP